jgi:hypothetical protein
VYSICFPIVLALQVATQHTHLQYSGAFSGIRLGLVEVVHLAIHHLPNRQMQLADAV